MNKIIAEKPQPLDIILERLQSCLSGLPKRYGVASLGVFSSYVRNEDTETSDLDILATFDEAPTFFQFIDLEDELSSLVDVTVDLVMKSALKPRIGEVILSKVIKV
jgi:hypothetical protein